jgi:hypothetical protein
VRDGVQHRFRRTFQNVGQADDESSFPQPDGVIHIRKRIKPGCQLRYRGTRTKSAIFLLKNLNQVHYFIGYLEFGRLVLECKIFLPQINQIAGQQNKQFFGHFFFF